MSTLFDPSVRKALTTRIDALRPDSARQWGRMSPHQAVCHLSDGFRMVLGEKVVRPRVTALGPVMRFVALSLPLG